MITALILKVGEHLVHLVESNHLVPGAVTAIAQAENEGGGEKQCWEEDKLVDAIAGGLATSIVLVPRILSIIRALSFEKIAMNF
jgi:hypothetical protein